MLGEDVKKLHEIEGLFDVRHLSVARTWPHRRHFWQALLERFLGIC
jgi:hypothetical protein